MSDPAVASTAAQVLALDGEIDIYQAAALKARMLMAIAANPRVALDLCGVIHLDSAGVQVLLLAARSAQGRGGSVSIVRHSQATEEVFCRLNLAPHFAPSSTELPA